MSAENSNRIIVTDIKMPFFSMVIFMVKWAVASIPALIILSFIGALIFGFAGTIFSHNTGMY